MGEARSRRRAEKPRLNPPLRSFGRIKGRPLKPRQAALFDTLLPQLALPDPELGPIDPAVLSPTAREIWLEIGFGGGEHLAAQAARRPDVLHLGAEPFVNGAASLLRHLDDQNLRNVRLHLADARALVAALPAASLARVFILFPDPWPKARHAKRRLIQPDFAAELVRVLRPGGGLRFATDWRDYADEALARLIGTPGLDWSAERADDWRRPPGDHAATRYEVKRLGDIAPLYFDFVRT